MAFFVVLFFLFASSPPTLGYIPPPDGSTPIECADHSAIEQFDLTETSFPFVRIETWACSGNVYERYSFDVRAMQGIRLQASEYNQSGSVAVEGWWKFTFKKISDATDFALKVEKTAARMIEEHKYAPEIETRIFNFIQKLSTLIFPIALSLAFARCLFFT